MVGASDKKEGTVGDCPAVPLRERGLWICDVPIDFICKNYNVHLFRGSNLCQAMVARVFVPWDPTIITEGVQILP